MNFSETVHSPEETWRVAAAFAERLSPGDVVCLEGELGAGKTTFVQGLGRALGVNRPMTSPTFVISLEYPLPKFKFVHMDLYRLHSPDDLFPIGWSEHLETGSVVCVEWPDRAGDLIPQNAWHVRIRLGEGQDDRIIDISRNDG